MKFFTATAYPWDVHYSEIKALYERYFQYLESLRGELPDHVIELAHLRGVDDGLVVEVHHIQSIERLILVLRCGDVQMGYYDLILTYEGANLSLYDECSLAFVARTTISSRRHKVDLDLFEVDLLEDGHIEHRLLFHTGGWIAIRCRELTWEKLPRPNRELPGVSRQLTPEVPLLPDRFPGGPVHPRACSIRGRFRAEPPRR